MQKRISCMVMLFFSCAAWGASGLYATYNQGFSGNLVLDGETGFQTDSTANKMVIGGGIFDGNLLTGQSQTGNAVGNELHLLGGNIQSPSATAGVSQNQQANNNLVRINNVTLQSNITAGLAAGNANGNTVWLEGSTVNYDSATQNKVIGGETFNAQASNNSIYVSNSSALNTTAAAGYSVNMGEVSYNTLNVAGNASVSLSGNNALYGGYTQGGNALHNQVSLSGTGSVQAQVYGGASLTGESAYNLVSAQESNIEGDIYGGYSGGAENSSYNEVHLGDGATVSGNVYGGYNGGSGGAGQNKISVSSGATLANTTQLYGGYGESSDAWANAVSIQSASAGAAAYGGYSASGNAYNNSLSLSGVTQGGNILSGGAAASGTSSGNSLIISDSTLSGSSFSGGSGNVAQSNILSVSNSTLNANVYGGMAQATATGNKVVLNNTQLTGNLYGGYSNGQNASGNTVHLSSADIDGDVYGGFSTDASAETTYNTVVLSGNTQVSGNLYGGTGPSNTGNKLLLDNYRGEIKEVNSFSNVVVQGLESYVGFRRDTQATFIPYGRPSAQTHLVAYALTANSHLSLGKDTLGVYRYSLTEGEDGTRTYWTAQGSFDRNLAKPYQQAQLAGLRLVSLGAEQLGGVFEEALKADSEQDLFTTFQYGQNRYDTGSHFDLQHLVLQAGKWFKMNQNAAGVFVQYARGHYSTDPVRATGSIDSFGLGAFGLIPYNESGYIKTIFRAGYKQDDFDSSALASHVENKGYYLGVLAGFVQPFEGWQVYGEADWTLLFGSDENDNLGQDIRFKNTQSLTGTLGIKAILADLGKGFKPYADVAGTYEFLAKSRMRIDGNQLNGTDLKGLSARAGVGVEYESQTAFLPVKGKVSVFGLLGKTEGVGGELKLMFRF
ncbi:MAG: autotransporter domain-containing protein [Elusimicrobiaceae bacterium]|nr:autotransporter domain-containing protein [Elusimicrobiaceae bacterium]